ncbi:MAG TPA: hypothetical protein VHF25_02600 [Nitriliruptorales bacterium]|nr:hypothetical protein [Nitriliruptorales bacterium]
MDQPAPEYGMTRAAVGVGALVAVPAVGLAGMLRGASGAVTAAGAVGLVVIWFALSALPMGWAAGRSPAMILGVALGGFVTRVTVLGLAIGWLTPIEAIDGHVLAVTVAVGTVVLLTYEAGLALRHAPIWWVDAANPSRAKSQVRA